MNMKTNIIGNPNGKGIEYDPELIKRLNKKTKGKKPEVKKVATESPDFSLEDKTDFYEIKGVHYNNGICRVNLSKTLLPSRTQEEHAEHRMNAKPNEFYLADMSLYHSLFTELFNNKDNSYKSQIEDARRFIKKSMLEHWLTTLTRVQYNPNGNDMIIHNYGQKDRREDNLNTFIGPNGEITKISNAEKPLQLLLNTNQHASEINSVYNWLADFNAYLWRLNSTPSKTDERVAGLYADAGGAYLTCTGNPSGLRGGFGVEIFPQEIKV